MMRNNKKILFIAAILLFCACWQLNQNREIEVRIPLTKGERILKMPLKDKKRLEYLFYDMLVWDVGGYTLFGVKPMHMNGYVKPFCMTYWYRFLSSIYPQNIRMYLSWKTWKKYEHFFKDSNILLYEEKHPFCKEPEDAIAIFLINKERFKVMVLTYNQDFKTVLKKDILSGEEILLQANDKSLFKVTLQNHEGLIGTLFGFGRNNAWLFEERKQGKTVPLSFLWSEDSEEHHFLMNRPDFAWSYFGICSDKLEEVLCYPTFMADPSSEETQNLKRTFRETRQKIIEYYKGKDFLETTLAILLEGYP